MSNSRRDARHQHYLEVARRLFAQHGFQRTTTDMIVAEAGGSKATLYKHFPSKVALLEGLMDQIADRINAATPVHVTEDTPVGEALTAIGRSALHGVLSPEAIEVVRLSLAEYAHFPQLAETVWKRGPAVTYANVRAFLQERDRRGELAIDDPQLAAERFIAGLVGHLQMKIVMGMADPPDHAEIERRVASAVRAFLEGHAP